ncbi:hypothetical protein BIW11_02403 [Tropilaelaps mercedesae]|uniref:Uncharacterized protein n=1 Tax=Tropilaelaps mercedesae TaxID=418985 RepID=A0A1V9Y3W2_9ACAR|nr:hypothetical protein BIW11_02403 [Tropilaelaps mercedesae]
MTAAHWSISHENLLVSFPSLKRPLPPNSWSSFYVILTFRYTARCGG